MSRMCTDEAQDNHLHQNIDDKAWKSIASGRFGGEAYLRS